MKLVGGLGNQLFQYACARSLAQKYNTNLTLDISFYYRNRLKQSLRESVDLAAALLGRSGLSSTIENISRNRRHYNLDKFQLRPDIKITKRNLPASIHDQDPFTFDRKIMQAGDNIIYEGYFNSYKYFKDIETELRTEFRLNKEIEANLPQDILKKIVTSNSISLHVRRGDYITRPEANKYHGSVDLSYYQKAVKIITEKVPDSIIFILRGFSVDLPS